MSRNLHGTILGRRRYSEELQHAFADLSGDHNPMHVDPVAARRTLVGGLAVHGIHQAVAALEALLAWRAKKRPAPRGIAGFKAQFLKPVLVDDVVSFYLTKLTDEGCLITGRIDGEVVFRASVQFGSVIPPVETALPGLAPEPVTELAFSQLAGQTGELGLGLDVALARKLFPLVTSELGHGKFAATLALTRLVGMRCPGLHSIFAEAAVRYDATAPSKSLSYRVVETEERYSHVALAAEGAHVTAQLKVFFRPPPQLQPTMAEVARIVKPGMFGGSIALIVGGSRGLGETTAKIIAAGGGLPIITFHHGSADAQRVADEIRAHGGRCELRQFDVEKSRPGLAKRLGGTSIKSIYYFATPKIPGRQHGFFSHLMLQKFIDVYVTAFGRLIDAITEISETKIRVLYPSSVMVTTGMEKMEEYIMAKRLAEDLCEFYNANAKKVEIIVERLPRMKTDQTNSIISLPTRDTLEVMVPLVCRVEEAVSQ